MGEARVEIVDPGGERWGAVMEYAGRCPWRAGPFLAKRMRQNALSGWERVFAAVEGGEIAGFCTLSETDFNPESGHTPYIGFVFVGEGYRGNRLSQRLIRRALDYAKTLDFQSVYLTSGERGLYEKYGFRKLDDAARPDGEESLYVISI